MRKKFLENKLALTINPHPLNFILEIQKRNSFVVADKFIVPNKSKIFIGGKNE